MTYKPADFHTTIPCTRCGHPVEIRVDGRLLASEAIAEFYRLGGICKECTEQNSNTKKE